MRNSFSGSALPAPAYHLLVFLVLMLGVSLRVYKFPEIPPGLNIDEAVSAYEAYSLLETGNDKWGHPLPAYFPGWGSGQNVLLSWAHRDSIKCHGTRQSNSKPSRE